MYLGNISVMTGPEAWSSSWKMYLENISVMTGPEAWTQSWKVYLRDIKMYLRDTNVITGLGARTEKCCLRARPTNTFSICNSFVNV